MAFDGITLKAVTNELQKILEYKIDKVFQPDKNTVILGLYGNGTNLPLLFCINSNNYRIHLTKKTNNNPTSAPNFCMLLRKHLIGLKIKKIYTLNLERIVFLELENNENPNKPIKKKLIIELMGKHSNVILVNNNNVIIDSLRHTSTENGATRDIYPTARYIFPEDKKLNFLELKNFEDFYSIIKSHLTSEIANSISSIFTGISSSFINSILEENNIQSISKKSLEIIYNKINEFLNFQNLGITINKNKKDYHLINTKESKDFSLNYELDNYYFEKETTELFINYKTNLLALILSTIKKYEKRLQNIDNKILECANMEKYRLYGELITANLYKIPNNKKEFIELENYYENNKLIKIPLNKQYVPSHNAKLYFKKYAKLKNALEIVNKQKEETINTINYFESIVYEIESSKTIEDLKNIDDEIMENEIFSSNTKKQKKNIKTKKAKLLTTNKKITYNPLKYTIGGYIVLVGKNNKENGYLTLKLDKKNDIWFHTKEIPGSHVILKNSTNDTIPENILYEVAKIAVLHSKAKNSSHVPVDYCNVSFVKKPSGSKPGFVTYSNNKTIYI